MANSPQARKRAIQAEKQRARNTRVKKTCRAAVKKTVKAINAGDQKIAQDIFKEAVKIMDRVADKSVFHKNKAARHKSRLSQRIKSMAQSNS
mgnify:FL=1